jgi:hypothetical protein
MGLRPLADSKRNELTLKPIFATNKHRTVRHLRFKVDEQPD